MTPKLSVVVHVDMDARHVRVAVTGHLTITNQQGLHPVIDHARTLTPDVTVTVDLTATDCPDPHAVARLRQALDHAAGPPGPITILAPATSSARNHPGRTEGTSHDTSTQEPVLDPKTAALHCSSLPAPKKPQHSHVPAHPGQRCTQQVPVPASLRHDRSRSALQQAPSSIIARKLTPAGAGRVLRNGSG